MTTNILVFNMGSSTNKLSLLQLRDGADAASEVMDGGWQSNLDLHGRERETVLHEQLNELSAKTPLDQIQFVGHRIVHGGRKFRQSTLITDEVITEIDRLCELAPLHNPAGLAGVRLSQKLLPQSKQVAVFDTAIHAYLPLERAVYAVPYSWYEKHEIQRYGFHGINHGYVARRAAEMLGEPNLRVVSCHLGNGCSVTGLVDNRSVYTSMGYTPLEGLVMGTRCGSIDPGIIVQALDAGLVDQAGLDDLLNKQSGLLGVSGRTNDMRELMQAADEGDERCRLAIDMFVHRLRCEIGATVATMDGADAIIFTGGIGENAAAIREQTCSRLSFLGVKLDSKANSVARADAVISTPSSRLKTLVVTAGENLAIAQECLKFVN